MKESKIEGSEKLIAVLGRIQERFLAKAKTIIDLNARALQRYVKTEKLTGGTTETKLKVRSGRLRGSVIPIPTEVKEDRVEGGISFGTIYARVHVGPKGQVTTIRPRPENKSGYLTIPFPQEYVSRTGKIYKPPAVISRKTPRKFIAFRKVKQVKIKSRVFPEDLIAWIKPKVIEDFAKKGIEVK